MSHPLNAAIEMAIQTADRSDEFRNLPGTGKPLAFLSNPGDAMVDRLLKETEVKPPAVQLKNGVTALQRVLKAETDEAARKPLMTEIDDQQLRMDPELEAKRKHS